MKRMGLVIAKQRWWISGVATALVACSVQNPQVLGPGDDFPSTITALGKAIEASVSAAQDWERFDGLPDTLADTIQHQLTGVDSLGSPPPKPSTNPLTKRSASTAAGDTVIWSLGDSLTGFVRRFSYAEDLYAWYFDTAIVRYNAAVLDSVRTNEQVLAQSGRVVYKSTGWFDYRFVDSDTNTFLDRAVFYYGTPQPGYTSMFTLTSTSGNDNNFSDWSKIKVPSFALYDLAGYDTLTLYAAADGDRDGSVYNNTLPVNDVDYRSVLTNRRPGESRFDERLLARMQADLPGSIDLLKYRSRSLSLGGRVEQFAVFGSRLDSICLGGDTATVTYDVVNGEAFDTVRSVYRVNLASGIYDWNNHCMLSYRTELRAAADTVVAFDFNFTATASLTVLDSLGSVNGTVTAGVRWRDGSTGCVDGAVINGEFAGHYVGADSTRRAIRWSIADGLVTQ